MQPYTPDLVDAWLKLDRANSHISQLKRKLGNAENDGRYRVPLTRQYESSDKAVVYRIGAVTEVTAEWSLIVGDAINNFRAALDFLAWQLALKHFGGVEPKLSVARTIYFPVVTGTQASWLTHSHRSFMDEADSELLKKYQPFSDREWPPNSAHPLVALNAISNSDKHRRLQIIQTPLFDGTFKNSGPGAYKDCAPDTRLQPDGARANAVMNVPTDPLRVGQEVMRIYVKAEGAKPDVDWEAELYCRVVVQENWDVIPMLVALDQGITEILTLFAKPN